MEQNNRGPHYPSYIIGATLGMGLTLLSSYLMQSGSVMNAIQKDINRDGIPDLVIESDSGLVNRVDSLYGFFENDSLVFLNYDDFKIRDENLIPLDDYPLGLLSDK